MDHVDNFRKSLTMEPIHLYDKDVVPYSSTSKGNQLKWKKDNIWYKANFLGYENVAEVVVSLLCSCIEDLDFIEYNLDKVFYKYNEYNVCTSKDFLVESELITFSHLLNQVGITSKKFNKLPPASRLSSVLKLDTFIPRSELCSYLNKVIYLDALILNEDRHLNNLALLKDSFGIYKVSPIFDNGLSLLSDTREYSFNRSLIENIIDVKSKPLIEKFSTQIRLMDTLNAKPLILDVNRFYSIIEDYNFTEYDRELDRCLDVLDYTLNKLEGLLWIQK